MDRLYRENYQKLPRSEREAILKDLANTKLGFTFKCFECFERFGQITDTAVYKFENSEFVFVHGDTVTLGWDSFAVGMDDTTKENIIETLEEYGVYNIEEFLKENMSPVRTIKIGPMLVERKLNDIGWIVVDSESSEVFEEERVKNAIEEIKSGKCQEYTFHEELRLRKSNDEITAEEYKSISYDEFVDSILESGFRLPTEDEWEYLCGGGVRTLFRWGDSFDYDMHLYHFEEATPNSIEYDLEKSNQFGISIGFDPYKQEIVMESEQFLKGGDGGCNICGGSGLALGYLPVATYYQDKNIYDEMLDYMSYIGGDYNFYRRIIRLWG